MDPAVRSFLSQPGGGDHLGLIAHSDGFLATAVAEWAGHTLASGGGAILVGTPTHLEMVRSELVRRGAPIALHERSGRAVLIDAEWMLAKFMLDGSPDGGRFRDLLDEIIARMTAQVEKGGPIRAWGEMVSLLRAKGNPRAAAKLEELWEETLRRHGLVLLCSYQTQEGEAGPTADLLRDVARAHPSWTLEPMMAERAG